MLRHWVLAARPKTLPVAMAPVIVGTALAWAESGRLDPAVTAVILAAAVLIQIGTNLHNDVADHERGADRPESRLGAWNLLEPQVKEGRHRRVPRSGPTFRGQGRMS